MATLPDCGALMDSIYRSQRHIYDASRKYYLFGRDRMIESLDLSSGDSVLEIACGTGRNLALIGRRWPGVELFGVDISAEMLKNAHRKLGASATLGQGDACRLNPMEMFGRAQFDCVVLSYATSMIPDWKSAMAQAASAVGRQGSLHLVDFGDMAGLPGPFRSLMARWLALFHVTPRPDLVEHGRSVADDLGYVFRARRGPAGYYISLSLDRR